MMRWVSLALVLFASVVQAADPKPNIVFIIADDVSWDDLGCYGHPRIRTPNLDQLARDGIKFTQAFLTTSSCSPSRCSILTGRYPHNTGAAELHMPLPRDQVVCSSLLRDAGYYTAAAGKWHLGEAARTHFDRIVAGAPSGCENWVKVLQERPKDRPFFFWFASHDAHRPYQARTRAKPHQPEDAVVPPFLPDVSATREDLIQYYDEIARLDDYVGKVRQELQKQKIAENTIILFIGDNGRPFPRCKTTLYDSGIRTPLLVCWPAKIKAGSVCHGLVSAVDFAPTFLDLADARKPASFQGFSFRPLLLDPSATIRKEIYAEHNWHDYQAHERAVRTTKWLYIRNSFPELTASPPADAVRSPTFQAMLKLQEQGKLSPEQQGCFLKPRPAEELYEVERDPHSLKNLASDPAQAAHLKEMRGLLDRWIKETGDRVPTTPRPDRYDRRTGNPVPKKEGKE